ncbi:class I SAM-dependent methyltransferase [Kitasatospora sp. NPDC096077]|uniref:class I SAM-dependent methyltransferase n=1 Tax=Kitasatospora sp. NPDC096077 TaxID=3155544 RepID=UPI00332C6552
MDLNHDNANNPNDPNDPKSVNDPKYRNVASVYDLVYETRTEDVEFYLEQAVKAAPLRLAEFGCGTGRVTLKLAERLPDTRIIAVDMDADEVEVLEDSLRARGIDTVETRCELIQDFEGEDLDLAIAPFRVFQHVTDPVEFEACLNRVARSLRPGGVFVFDLFNPSVPLLARTGLIASQVFEDGDGHRIERTVNVNDRDHFRQTQFVEEDYTVFTPEGGTYDLHWHYHTRYYFLGEVVPLIERAGFEVVRVDSDYRGTPFGKGPYPGDLVFHLVRK